MTTPNDNVPYKARIDLNDVRQEIDALLENAKALANLMDKAHYGSEVTLRNLRKVIAIAEKTAHEEDPKPAAADVAYPVIPTLHDYLFELVDFDGTVFRTTIRRARSLSRAQEALANLYGDMHHVWLIDARLSDQQVKANADPYSTQPNADDKKYTYLIEPTGLGKPSVEVTVLAAGPQEARAAVRAWYPEESRIILMDVEEQPFKAPRTCVYYTDTTPPITNLRVFYRALTDKELGAMLYGQFPPAEKAQ